MARSCKAVMLHGFLGSSADWSLVLKSLAAQDVICDVLTPDFFRDGPLSAAHDFTAWTANLNQEVEERFGAEPVHLLGYSLGGRLALHAALAFPQRWRSLWILSSNPGVFLAAPEERVKWEAETAGKFLERPWPDLMKEWNSEAVFNQTTPRLTPREGTLSRELLAKSFISWSVTKHRFTVPELERLPMPVEWWFGEHDTKYLDVKREMERQNVKGRYRLIEGAGHRIPLDRPDLIAKALLENLGDTQ